MNKNGPGGLALTVARYEASEGGMEQMYIAFGDQEEDLWKQNYSSTFDSKDK